MSYLKTTVIGGKTAGGAYKSAAFSGHWKPTAMLRKAGRMGLAVDVHGSHSTSDMSGKGRGSDDAEFTIDMASGTVTKVRGYRDYDDAADVHAICDATEDR